jgi:hypothetical protein
MGRSAGYAQDDSITARTAHDGSHSVSVDVQNGNRSRRPATGAFGASDRQIRNEQLAQDSCRGIAIDALRIGSRLSCSTLFHGPFLSAREIIVKPKPIRL